MKAAPVLEVRRLNVYGDDIRILKNIDWRVEKKQHWVVLGSNGSGKTSLLSTLCGYLMPGSGELSILGQVYGESDWRDLRREIGLVSSSIRQKINDDELPLEIVISGKYAILNYWGKVKPAECKRARQLLRQLGCASLAARPWLYLSQGERQRILIARALMAEPKILILDEPCAGLDPVARFDFLKFVEVLGRSKTSPNLVLVTHHVEEITPAFSHVLLLKKGAVLLSGKKRDILNSRNVSETFGARIHLTAKAGRYSTKL